MQKRTYCKVKRILEIYFLCDHPQGKTNQLESGCWMIDNSLFPLRSGLKWSETLVNRIIDFSWAITCVWMTKYQFFQALHLLTQCASQQCLLGIWSLYVLLCSEVNNYSTVYFLSSKKKPVKLSWVAQFLLLPGNIEVLKLWSYYKVWNYPDVLFLSPEFYWSCPVCKNAS